MSYAAFGPFVITPHAAARARQRGLKSQAIELVLGLHDRAVSVGNGHQAWSVSRKRCSALRDAGLPASVIERLDRTIVVVEPLVGVVITVINGYKDANRRYRRGEQGRRKRAWKVAV